MHVLKQVPILVLSLIVLSPNLMPASAQETLTQRIERILSQVPLIDGHNDLPGQIRDIQTPEGDVGLYLSLIHI